MHLLTNGTFKFISAVLVDKLLNAMLAHRLTAWQKLWHLEFDVAEGTVKIPLDLIGFVEHVDSKLSRNKM